MKLPVKEVQILNFLTVAVALYDYFTIPFNSFLITLLLGIVFYCFTKSQVLFVCVLLAPQFIRFVNGVILGKKEMFMVTNPQEVVENLKKMKKPSESFVNLKEVSERVVNLKNESKVPPVEKLSALVDSTPIMPSVDSIAFLEQFENRTDLTENTRIMTIPENAVPAVGTVERNARAMAAVEAFDAQAVNTALVRSTNTGKPVSSELESVEVNRDAKTY
jgi:hypothetical protein